MTFTLKIFTYFILIAQIFPKSYSGEGALNDTWRSENDSRYRVWFQNWSGYTRLFITINEDTLSVEANKYAVTNKEKPYLFPASYNKILKRQIIGNIDWDDKISWEDGHINTFTYIVDRSNPKISLPVKFEGIAVLENKKLRLELISNRDLKYHMQLVPTSVE
tara:strand:- start:16 stop:504 length:489 start_codon:yes stop_codon:yes gene_type:complete